MIRYSTGIFGALERVSAAARARLKQIGGAVTFYPVCRTWVDHSLYYDDNRRLRTTLPSLAKVLHQVSWQGELAKPAVVEFEHAFALLGHLEDDSDFARFREDAPARLRRFLAWFNTGPHRLIAPTRGALRSLLDLCARAGVPPPTDRIDVLPWARTPRRRRVRLRRRLAAFHFSGAFPYRKGTQDVLAIARQLPGITFRIAADLGHELFRRVSLPNVELFSFRDKVAYDRALLASQLLLHPIYADGWGVVLDALSTALPMVIYDSYDKDEALVPGETGTLIRLPKTLSFYDSFWEAELSNWPEYFAHILNTSSSDHVDAMATAVDEYVRRPDLIDHQSQRAAALLETRFGVRGRMKRLNEIYREVLQGLS